MDGLPCDLLRHILLFLRLDEIRQCFRVCKKWLRATEHHYFWMTICKRFERFGIPLQYFEKLTWQGARAFFCQFLSNGMNFVKNFDELDVDKIDYAVVDDREHYYRKKVFFKRSFDDTPVLREVIIRTPFTTDLIFTTNLRMQCQPEALILKVHMYNQQFFLLIGQLLSKLDVCHDVTSTSDMRKFVAYTGDSIEVYTIDNKTHSIWSTDKRLIYDLNDTLQLYKGGYIVVKIDSASKTCMNFKLMRLELLYK